VDAHSRPFIGDPMTVGNAGRGQHTKRAGFIEADVQPQDRKKRKV
jgi:hypothetical protein